MDKGTDGWNKLNKWQTRHDLVFNKDRVAFNFFVVLETSLVISWSSVHKIDGAMVNIWDSLFNLFKICPFGGLPKNIITIYQHHFLQTRKPGRHLEKGQALKRENPCSRMKKPWKKTVYFSLTLNLDTNFSSKYHKSKQANMTKHQSWAGIKHPNFWDLHKQLGQCYQAKGDSLKSALKMDRIIGILQWNGAVLESLPTFKRCFWFLKRDFGEVSNHGSKKTNIGKHPSKHLF